MQSDGADKATPGVASKTGRGQMKDRAILSLKGLAIIGVVTHHIVNRRQDPMAADYLNDLCLAFNWCVVGFICISGYLHALSDTRREKGLAEFIHQRFNRLIIPFVALVIFYALIWQVLRALHFSTVGVSLPPDFIGKVTASLWPVNQHTVVAEQLYYLPLLFGASLVFICARKMGIVLVWAITLLTFLIGLRYYPGYFTMFRMGAFYWSICFYAMGYLLFRYREKVIQVRMTLFVVTLFLMVFGGIPAFVGCIPLWLLSEGERLKLGSLPVLPRLGEASGTIYIYHTPFIVQTLSVAATHLPGWKLQFIGALGAGTISIAICYAIYELLKNTRAKVILM